MIPGSEVLRKYATPSGWLIMHAEAHYDERTTVDVDDPKYPTLENGLRHMTGNVWQWMQNFYDTYPEGPVTDPTGPTSGDFRALRGGSWNIDEEEFLRAACRNNLRPGGYGDNAGFRVVVVPQDSLSAGQAGGK